MASGLSVLGVALGVLLLIGLGWIPVAGAFVAGYVIGMHIKGRRESVTFCFIVGAVSAVILAWLFYVVSTEVFVVTEGPLSGFGGSLFTFFFSLGPIFLIAQTIVFAVLGGYAGSRVREMLFSK